MTTPADIEALETKLAEVNAEMRAKVETVGMAIVTCSVGALPLS